LACWPSWPCFPSLQFDQAEQAQLLFPLARHLGMAQQASLTSVTSFSPLWSR
jgi:hypothetical protein